MQLDDVTEKVGELSENAQHLVEAGRENLGEVDAWVRQTVRRYPGATLFGFLTVGYLVGRVVARR